MPTTRGMPRQNAERETVSDEGRRVSRWRSALTFVLWAEVVFMSFAPPVHRHSWRVAIIVGVATSTAAAQLWIRSSLRRFLDRLQTVGAAERAEQRRVADALKDNRRRVQRVVSAGDDLTIVYQPIVDFDSWKVVGFEALSRFGDGRAPTEWFAEAAELGLGVEMEMLAVSRAIPGAPAEGYLSLNVSCPTLLSAAFDDFIRERANDRIVIELTEHSAIADYEAAGQVVEALRASGARLAVDDAGGGYASMRHIVSLRPDLIKLDRSLVSDLHNDHSKREMARLLNGFALSTGATLVAEGLETAEELNACREVGIRFGQGYLLGRPEPHDAHLAVSERAGKPKNVSQDEGR